MDGQAQQRMFTYPAADTSNSEQAHISHQLREAPIAGPQPPHTLPVPHVYQADNLSFSSSHSISRISLSKIVQQA